MSELHHKNGDTEKKGGDEKMITRSISVPASLWTQARKKVVPGSLSAVIQKFLRLWVADKINLDDFDDE